MRAVLQRVSSARVEVDGEIVGAIDRGVLVLVAVETADQAPEVDALAAKIAGLRIFEDAEGKMNLDLVGTGGSVLVVSQFTLAASLRRGRRPSFNGSAPPEAAEPLVERLIERLRAADLVVASGRFRADMDVHLVNDGPVTLILDVRDGRVC